RRPAAEGVWVTGVGALVIPAGPGEDVQAAATASTTVNRAFRPRIAILLQDVHRLRSFGS
ncbi:MAG: hypothetical protein M3O88_07680, partial [Actinomycetota bacterium]|nr:hypothetical protein [Actinomycetota bacterium]